VNGQTAGAPTRRAIRSFVRREGRLTPAQARALDTLWPRFGLAPEALPDLDRAFPGGGPLTLEIGFGNGEVLAELARRHPERRYLGMEVYRPGIGRLLRVLEGEGIGNVRLVQGDAAELLPRLPAGALDEVLIFFPDPWPKKRHHKRRLIQPPFVAELVRVLRPGGRLHLATDWEDYARHMLEVLERTPELENLAGAGRFVPRPASRPETKFERRGRRRAHAVFDLLYRRTSHEVDGGA
jgi:tRNA (guanine-N7-)-methyltransferase